MQACQHRLRGGRRVDDDRIVLRPAVFRAEGHQFGFLGARERHAGARHQLQRAYDLVVVGKDVGGAERRQQIVFLKNEADGFLAQVRALRIGHL